MTPATKKLALIRIIMDVSAPLMTQHRENDLVRPLAQVLAQEALIALRKCDAKISRRTALRTRAIIDSLYRDGDQVDTLEFLSFALYGVQELRHHTRKKKDMETLEAALIDVILFFDPRLEKNQHGTAVKKYHDWVK